MKIHTFKIVEKGICPNVTKLQVLSPSEALLIMGGATTLCSNDTYCSTYASACFNNGCFSKDCIVFASPFAQIKDNR
jgi:hypothetical protein